MEIEARYRRRFDNRSDDHRSRSQRDRDRVLFSGDFRRLAGVTQVTAPLEAHLFHNRLTHSLEVAQVGRRIAERLRGEDSRLEPFIDGDVVEAACLVHDLGHPPFGHAAEQELDSLAVARGLTDGFEGNAQSFRIVTRLAVHGKGLAEGEFDGLDLCRATLNACLKYPHLRDRKKRKPSNKRYRKYGAYDSDKAMFAWAREGSRREELGLEAQIMDHADDVANSVHDIIDFFRAGLLPFSALAYDPNEWLAFENTWKGDEVDPMPSAAEGLADQFRDLISWFLVLGSPREKGEAPSSTQYEGLKPQRRGLSVAASELIRRFDKAATVEWVGGNKPTLKIDRDEALNISFLKRVFLHYLILNSRLATQQRGQRAVIRGLFNTYLSELGRQSSRLIPGRFRHEVERLRGRDRKDRVRIAVDIVASFTDAQALSMFRRLSGAEPGSVTDIIEW